METMQNFLYLRRKYCEHGETIETKSEAALFVNKLHLFEKKSQAVTKFAGVLHREQLDFAAVGKFKGNDLRIVQKKG